MENSLNKKIALHGEIAEIKRIYSAIASSLLKKNPACLVITSAASGEGKTTVVAGLAAYAARQNNKRVLAMDLNWYSPALHKSFGLDLTFGFDALKNSDSIFDLVKSSGLENLDILPAVQASEGSEVSFGEIDAQAVSMIKKARENYSFVVVDTSPMFPPNRRMIDPAIISKEADGVALVALANETPREGVKRATKTLEAAGANIIGVIANQWQNPMA
ncbi:MAG: CpsD/CapB family tyrosine-protein kinase [Deltaproteobacteria bacterium]|nr:CpsD/CapB family tyrosine-protein kinase [Deltaproteobacteria bacterium]